jgi:hypothetical protein
LPYETWGLKKEKGNVCLLPEDMKSVVLEKRRGKDNNKTSSKQGRPVCFIHFSVDSWINDSRKTGGGKQKDNQTNERGNWPYI